MFALLAYVCIIVFTHKHLQDWQRKVSEQKHTKQRPIHQKIIDNNADIPWLSCHYPYQLFHLGSEHCINKKTCYKHFEAQGKTWWSTWMSQWSCLSLHGKQWEIEHLELNKQGIMMLWHMKGRYWYHQQSHTLYESKPAPSNTRNMKWPYMEDNEQHLLPSSYKNQESSNEEPIMPTPDLNSFHPTIMGT